MGNSAVKAKKNSAGKPFAVFDIDGTLIRWQLFHAIVGELAKQKQLADDAEFKIREARMTWKRRAHENSFNEYQDIMKDVYFDALKDISFDAHLRAVDKVFEEYKDQVYTYTRDLVKSLKAEGYFLLAISGSHHDIIAKLAEYYGFDDLLGAVFLTRDGKFTGEIDTPVTAKHLALENLTAKHGLTYEGSIGVGDSEGDIPILKLVETPIAFNPSKALFGEAMKNSWKVVVERKNMIYELENQDGKYFLAKTNA